MILKKEEFDDLLIKIDKIIEQLNQHLESDQLSDVWLNSKDAAKALSITTRTLQSYRDQGLIPFSQFRREIRYKASDIQDFLMTHYVKSSYQRGGVS